MQCHHHSVRHHLLGHHYPILDLLLLTFLHYLHHHYLRSLGHRLYINLSVKIFGILGFSLALHNFLLNSQCKLSSLQLFHCRFQYFPFCSVYLHILITEINSLWSFMTFFIRLISWYVKDFKVKLMFLLYFLLF